MNFQLEPVKGSGALWFVGIIMLLISVILLFAKSCSNSISTPNPLNLHWHLAFQVKPGYVNSSPYANADRVGGRELDSVKMLEFRNNFPFSFNGYTINDGVQIETRYRGDITSNNINSFVHGTITCPSDDPPTAGNFDLYDAGSGKFVGEKADAAGRHYIMRLWAQ